MYYTVLFIHLPLSCSFDWEDISNTQDSGWPQRLTKRIENLSTPLRVLFSTLLSVFGNVVSYDLSCMIYYTVLFNAVWLLASPANSSLKWLLTLLDILPRAERETRLLPCQMISLHHCSRSLFSRVLCNMALLRDQKPEHNVEPVISMTNLKWTLKCLWSEK